MAQSQIALQMEGLRVEVSGLRETLQALELAGAASEDMRELMHSTGSIIADAARPLAPVGQTGRLKASIRAGRGKTKAVIRAGTGVRVPYAGVVHYGWPARNIHESMFLVRAFHAKRDQALQHITTGITDLLRKNRLI